MYKSLLNSHLSIENEFSLREGLLLQAYFKLKDLGLSDEKAFGLEKSDVIVEEVPLIFNTVDKIGLVRVETKKTLSSVQQ